jgi:hypothetical protein
LEIIQNLAELGCGKMAREFDYAEFDCQKF